MHPHDKVVRVFFKFKIVIIILKGFDCENKKSRRRTLPSANYLPNNLSLETVSYTKFTYYSLSKSIII